MYLVSIYGHLHVGRECVVEVRAEQIDLARTEIDTCWRMLEWDVGGSSDACANHHSALTAVVSRASA